MLARNPRQARIAAMVLVVALSAGACVRGGGSSTPAPTPGETGTAVTGTVTAGPTCPVVRNPPDSACADRPVSGAVIVVTDAGGKEVLRATSSSSGELSFSLPPGAYHLVPQQVTGLMGTAKPIDLTVPASGSPAPVQVVYDTGIR